MATYQGRRIDQAPHLHKPCDYGKWIENGVDHGWYAETPNGHGGNLNGHDLTVHPDGTLTVAPSIQVTWMVKGQEVELWHGYLEKGVWRDC